MTNCPSLESRVRRFLIPFVGWAPLCMAGCGEDPQVPPRPAQGSEPEVEVSTGGEVPGERLSHSAEAGGGAHERWAKSSDPIQVDILDVKQVDPRVVTLGDESSSFPQDLEPALRRPPMLALMIRVANNCQALRLSIGTRRFRLESPTGNQIRALASDKVSPRLPECYLKAGQSVSGWLVFPVPREETKLTLTSDLRRPPIEIPLSVPGS